MKLSPSDLVYVKQGLFPGFPLPLFRRDQWPTPLALGILVEIVGRQLRVRAFTPPLSGIEHLGQVFYCDLATFYLAFLLEIPKPTLLSRLPVVTSKTGFMVFLLSLDVLCQSTC